MDLTSYNIDVLLLTAIKSEIDSNNAYRKIAGKIDNGLLKDKLEFLADEENKHKMIIEDIFRNHFPDQKLIIPEKTVVPLPEIEIMENTPISNLLEQAMQAEKAAQEFYESISGRFEDDSKIENTLKYFATMELGHYKLLEIEKENMEKFEEADVYWPMVHAGP